MFEKSIFCIVATLAPSILIGSSSFLEETRISITYWMSSNLSQIRPWTAELAALVCLKNQFLVLWPLQHLQFLSDLALGLIVTYVWRMCDVCVTYVRMLKVEATGRHGHN